MLYVEMFLKKRGEKRNSRSGENGTAGEECFRREEQYWI